MPRTPLDRVLEIGTLVTALLIFSLSILSRLQLGPWAFRPSAAWLLFFFALVATRVWRSARSSSEPPPAVGLAPGSWLATLRGPGLFVLGCGLVVFHLFQHYGGRLTSDGVINFIYLRSVVIDRDLDLTNEFRDFVPDKFQIIADISRAAGRTPDPSNEPGPAVLWSPFYLAAHAMVGVSRWSGGVVEADGYSYPYINAVSLAGVFYAFVAVAIAYRLATRFYPSWLSALAVCGLWLSSTLYWYTVFEPTMPHATTAAVASAFLWAWLEARERPTTLRWVVVGLLGGLLLSMQRYAVFFFAAPALTLAAGAFRWWRGERKMRPKLRSALVVAGAILLAALPMLAYNFFHSGGETLVRAGDLGGTALRHWSDPRIAELLYSTHHGLFAWTPAAYLAVVGLAVFVLKHRHVGLTLLVTLACGVYLLGSTWDWYAGTSFGARRLTEAFAIFALGFTAFADFLVRRPRIVVACTLFGLVAGNLLLADLVSRGIVSMEGTVDFPEVASEAAERLYGLTGHPASVPAPLVFARRYGVPPDRFDRIFGHRSYSNLAIDVGGDDGAFLGRGWSDPESGGDGSRFRWSEGESSTWLVSLFDPFPYRLRLTGASSRHPDGRALPVAIFVNGHSVGALAFTTERQTLERLVGPEFWRRGLNEIELRYGWTVEADLVYRNDDRREIALSLEALELEIAR